MVKLIGVFVAAFLTMPAFAGDELGNGGDAVVCRGDDGTITTAETLDHYEARKLLQFAIDVGPSAETEPGEVADGVIAKVEAVLARIPAFDESRHQVYASRLADLPGESIFLANVTLADIPDSAHVVVENGCAVEQAVIHKEPAFPGVKRYTFNRDIWDALDADSQATLLVHELIYREASERGQSNSIASRYLTARLIRADAVDLSLEDYVTLMELVDLPVDAECHTVGRLYANYVSVASWRACFVPGTIVRDEDDNIVEGYLSAPRKLPYGTRWYSLSGVDLYNAHVRGAVTFYAGGLLAEATLASKQYLHTERRPHSVPAFHSEVFPAETRVSFSGQLATAVD